MFSRPYSWLDDKVIVTNVILWSSICTKTMEQSIRVHYGLNMGTRFFLHFCQRPRLTGLALGGVSESTEIYYLATWGPESIRGGGDGGKGGGSACVTRDAGGETAGKRTLWQVPLRPGGDSHSEKLTGCPEAGGSGMEEEDSVEGGGGRGLRMSQTVKKSMA